MNKASIKINYIILNKTYELEVDKNYLIYLFNEYNCKKIYEKKKEVSIRKYIKILSLKRCLSILENE